MHDPRSKLLPAGMFAELVARHAHPEASWAPEVTDASNRQITDALLTAAATTQLFAGTDLLLPVH